MANLVDFGILFRTEGATSAQQDINAFKAAAVDAARETQRLERGIGTGLRNTLRNNSFAVTNAANQFSDFAVQVGAGVPVTRALSQQLPQLTAFMGPAVAILGVASGVLIGLAGSFFAARAEAEEFEDAVDLLEEGTQRIIDLSGSQAASLSDLQEQLERTSEAYRTLQSAALEATTSLETEDRIQRQIDFVEEVAQEFRAGFGNNIEFELFTEFSEQLDLARRELEFFQQESMDFDIQIARGQITALTSMLADLPPEVQAAAEALEALEEAANGTEEEFGAAAAGMVEALEELSESGDFRGLIARIAELATNVIEQGAAIEGAAAGAAAALNNLSGAEGELNVRAGVANGSIPPHALGDLPATPAERAFNAAMEARRREAARAARSSGGGGGGGGGGMDAAEEELRRLERLAEQVFRSTRTEQERYNESLQDYQTLLEAGLISQDTFNRALADLDEQFLNSADIIKGIESTIQGELNTAFRSVLDGTATVGEALMQFANNVLLDIAERLFDQLIAQPLSRSIGGLIGGILTSADGNAFGSTGVHPFAMGGIMGSGGGVLTGPTLFTFANGGKLGLGGEAGEEAILPLARGSNGKLGVQGSATSVTINNYGNQEVDVSEDRNGDPVITIGRVIARDIQNGGPTFQAIRKAFGSRPQIIGRG